MLVIGGPHAGMLMPDLSGPVLELLVHSPGTVTLFGEGEPDDIRVERYARKRIVQDGRTFHVWVHPSVGSVFVELLDRYRAQLAAAKGGG